MHVFIYSVNNAFIDQCVVTVFRVQKKYLLWTYIKKQRIRVAYYVLGSMQGIYI